MITAALLIALSCLLMLLFMGLAATGLYAVPLLWIVRWRRGR